MFNPSTAQIAVHSSTDQIDQGRAQESHRMGIRSASIFTVLLPRSSFQLKDEGSSVSNSLATSKKDMWAFLVWDKAFVYLIISFSVHQLPISSPKPVPLTFVVLFPAEMGFG